MNGAPKPSSTDFDVIIVGAGISGINAAYRVQTELPDASYTVLEARDAMGGTWDLFRFPGIRSDSDLYTFGFPWRPWMDQKLIAEGAAIRKYIDESAAEYGIDRKVQFHHKLVSADWSSDQQSWSLQVDANGETKYYHARFVILSTGYYDYDEVLSSTIPGISDFKGTVIHPQFWPGKYDYTGQKIIVIGSGATAVTLVPVLAEKAAHVTMLQRSPGYILSRPSVDPTASWMTKILPAWLVFSLIRAKFLIVSQLFVTFCRRFPNAARNLIRKETEKRLPENIPHDPHFHPRYNPWEQRLCLDPDAKFFKALRSGKADVATGTIKRVTATGIEMHSGQFLPADLIVTATGLKIQVGGGTSISVDHRRIDITKKFLWKGVMVQDVPNLATVIGYTNASWTLGADATAQLVCRLLKLMRDEGVTAAVPRCEDAGSMRVMPVLDLNSTYVERGKGDLPRAGSRGPWRPRKAYWRDLWEAKFGSLREGLVFERVAV